MQTKKKIKEQKQIEPVEEDKQYPVYKGKVTREENGKYVVVSEICLWQNNSQNEKAPVLTGVMVVNGQIARAALWDYIPKKTHQERE